MIALFEACIGGKWITVGDDTQYKIVDDLLVFQCSASVIDWKANFDFYAVPYKDMTDPFLVHRGFLKRWKDARKAVQAEYSKVRRIAGYSHGAALAILAHEDYWFVNGRQPETLVFGAPKVFFGKVPDRFSGVTRAASKGDVVTWVPPFYRHVGREILLDKKTVRREPWLSYLAKHSPDVYRQRLV